ncbi:MAG: protein arginine kinase [Clostridia bacterium]|nr:protein arginine kinase [Clostridia bacterium]
MAQEKWYQRSGAEGDVVISTRIRLARDLAHLPFPAWMTAEQREDVITQVFGAFPNDQPCAFERRRMSDVPARELLAMVERHLISREFARDPSGEALLITADEGVSIMVGEEDHLRIQVLRSGFDLDSAWQEATCWDDYLDTRLHFAFDERLGYLTQCPTNLGTGMRASVMLHLPALQEKGIIQQLSVTVSKLGLTIRGLYGEGSKPEGALYQISNQVTLGITEQEAIDNLRSIVNQIIREERSCREQLKDSPAFEDRVFRSLGILQNARLLTGNEFMTLISPVRMGVALGMIDHTDLNALNSLLIDAGAGALMEAAGEELDAAQRDVRRAALVRERLR